MAVRKFSEVQFELLEKEYKAGLNSVSVKKVGDRIKHLAERAGLEEATVKTWINNRKRGPPPTCFPSTSTTSNEEPSKAKKALRLPSVSRQPSGYNSISSNHISMSYLKVSVSSPQLKPHRWMIYIRLFTNFVDVCYTIGLLFRVYEVVFIFICPAIVCE